MRILELSGGKDSVACLYLLRDQLADITVVWLDTGDAYPETVRVINECRKLCPNFKVIRSNVMEWVASHGFPSDVLLADGRKVHLPNPLPLADRYECCAANIMTPMHEAVLAMNPTEIIRGQKNADGHKGPLQSGQVVDGVTYTYPLEGWTDEDVLKFLEEQSAPIHSCYEYSNHGVDCMHCTAWWEHKHLGYLYAVSPETYRQVKSVRQCIRKGVNESMELC